MRPSSSLHRAVGRGWTCRATSAAARAAMQGHGLAPKSWAAAWWTPTCWSRCGIDSKKYSGFAFGMGIERIAMLKYGVRTCVSISRTTYGSSASSNRPSDTHSAHEAHRSYHRPHAPLRHGVRLRTQRPSGGRHGRRRCGRSVSTPKGIRREAIDRDTLRAREAMPGPSRPTPPSPQPTTPWPRCCSTPTRRRPWR